MSPRIRRLSGAQVITILRTFGFEVISQKGSHAKLRRYTGTGDKQTLTIPIHDELDIGTLRAIVRQAGRYLPEDELHPQFFSD